MNRHWEIVHLKRALKTTVTYI